MLLVVIAVLFSEVHNSEGTGAEVKPCTFPIPLDLPNRNDRSNQCWLRIEDGELVETITVFCYVANAFLRSYIHDYNSRKMTEDNVDVSLWSEEARPQEDISPKSPIGPKGVKDWKSTTILDPITHMRLYVTKEADCRLIMYNRDGTSNYKMNCESILYFVNDRTHGSATAVRGHIALLSFCVFLVYSSIKYS